MRVPLLNFEGGPGVPPLNFEGGPEVPLLNFRGVQGPTFKLSEGSQVTRSRVLGSWSYFYTMPFSYLFHDYDVTSLENIYSITF